MPLQRTQPPTAALIAALIGATLLIMSAFLVWGSLDIGIGTISEKGTDSSAGIAVIALAIGVVAVLAGAYTGLPRNFVRGAWALFGVAALGLGVYALIQINNAPTDFFSGVNGAIKDSGVGGVLGQLGISDQTVKNATSQITSVDYGPGVFVAMAGGVATLVGALALNRRQG